MCHKALSLLQLAKSLKLHCCTDTDGLVFWHFGRSKVRKERLKIKKKKKLHLREHGFRLNCVGKCAIIYWEAWWSHWHYRVNSDGLRPNFLGSWVWFSDAISLGGATVHSRHHSITQSNSVQHRSLLLKSPLPLIYDLIRLCKSDCCFEFLTGTECIATSLNFLWASSFVVTKLIWSLRAHFFPLRLLGTLN